MGKHKDHKSKSEKKKSKNKYQAKERVKEVKPNSIKKDHGGHAKSAAKSSAPSSASSLFSVVSAGPTSTPVAANESSPGFTVTAIGVVDKKSSGNRGTTEEEEEPVRPSTAMDAIPTPSIPVVAEQVSPNVDTDAMPRVIHVSSAPNMCQREDSQPFRFAEARYDEQQVAVVPPPEVTLHVEAIRPATENIADSIEKEAKQPAKLKGQDAKKIATGGVNQFDMDIVKTGATETPAAAPAAGDRRARRARSQAPDFLKAGPGILARALLAERTVTGLAINTDKATRLNTLLDESKKRADLLKSANRRASEMLIVMDAPFNQISVITNFLGLTGAWGVVVERLAQFPRKVGCVINATYEAPLLQVEGLESYRVPVADSKTENLSIYFDEVTEKMHEFELKGMGIIVHCIAGVSRSASIVIAYLMRYHESKSLEKAFCLVKSARTVVNPNLAFLEQLAAYEKKLHGEDNCSPWHNHSENGITKRLPEFIINHFIDDYQIEFAPDRIDV